jgi:transcriptional regulator with XRE-family HTH domain
VEDAEKLKEHVGRRMAHLREAAGLTQADVAEKIGTTIPNLQRIEYGTQNATIETMAKIANSIGVRVAAFFEPLSAPKRRRAPGRPKRT